MKTQTILNAPDLFDAKGSCLLCSTSTVQRRVNAADYVSHAKAHKAQGDPVQISGDSTSFKVVSE